MNSEIIERCQILTEECRKDIDVQLKELERHQNNIDWFKKRLNMAHSSIERCRVRIKQLQGDIVDYQYRINELK